MVKASAKAANGPVAKGPSPLQTQLTRAINALADFLSTAVGFIATFLVLCIGIAVGWLLHFNEGFMFGFNIFLSVAAIVISGIILVAAARSEAAMQVKLDYLIEFSKATNAAIGLEHKDYEEIEAQRQMVEAAAARGIGQAIEEEVEDEVAEQLESRTVAKTKRVRKTRTPSRAKRPGRVSRAPSDS